MKAPVDPDLTRELVEERAAIIEEATGCTRWLAQQAAAKEHGFASWPAFLMSSKRSAK